MIRSLLCLAAALAMAVAAFAADISGTWTASFETQVSEHFLAALNLAGFVRGAFLKQSPLSNAIVFFNFGLAYRF